jgi:hypothetical protein
MTPPYHESSVAQVPSLRGLLGGRAIQALRQPAPYRRALMLAWVAAITTSVMAGTFLVSRPLFALFPVAALAGLLLLLDGRARLLYVLFGGMYVLQVPGGLDATKTGFLAGALVAFVGAFLRVQNLRHSDAYVLARPLFGASSALVALAVVSLPVAYFNGIPQDAWTRDIDPYLFLAAVPVFALDAQDAFRREALVRLLVLAGTVGAMSFAVQWLQRRGIAHLPIERLGLSSLLLPAALFAYSMSAGLQIGARRMRWFVLAACIFAMLLSTSTRSAFVIAIAPLAIVLGARKSLTPRAIRLLLVGPLTVVLTLALAQGIIVVTGADSDVLTKRITIIKGTGDMSKDASYNDRKLLSRVAWDVFKESELVGAGAGTSFEWKPQGLSVRTSSTMDTPLTFPAKFGLLGLLVALIVCGKYWSFVRRLRRSRSLALGQLTLVGYFAVVVLLSVLNNTFEDKGLSFGLILAVAIALREATSRLQPSIKHASLQPVP